MTILNRPDIRIAEDSRYVIFNDESTICLFLAADCAV
jgi:hypothetical protein